MYKSGSPSGSGSPTAGLWAPRPGTTEQIGTWYLVLGTMVPSTKYQVPICSVVPGRGAHRPAVGEPDPLGDPDLYTSSLK